MRRCRTAPRSSRPPVPGRVFRPPRAIFVCGSPWTLAVKQVVDRATDFEMSYNPNDCVELRWAAGEGSEEAATCKRHAPQAQRAKMSEYRAWFRERHWPAHS